jgi:hypothetical protein
MILHPVLMYDSSYEFLALGVVIRCDDYLFRLYVEHSDLVGNGILYMKSHQFFGFYSKNE